MLSTISKPAIATRITNQLVRTSLGTQLSHKTTSTLASVPIVVNGGARTTTKFVPRKEKSNYCGIIGHYAKKCRKPKKPYGQSSIPPQTNVNQIDKTAEKSDDEESVNYITSYQQLYDQVYGSHYDSDSDDYEASISFDSATQLEPLNNKTQFGKVQANAMVDSGSVVSLITKKLANRILRITPSAKCVTTKKNKDLKIFSSEPIKVLGQPATMVTYNDWTCKEAHLTVVADWHKIIMWRDLFNCLGLAVVQQQAESGKCVNNINNYTCKIGDTIAAQFPHLAQELAFHGHIAKPKFQQNFTAKHQKDRRVPINLHARVTMV